jgi:transcriptional regulator with XRE-family HTH domain
MAASRDTHRFKSEALLMARMRLGLTQRQVAGRCQALGQPVSDSNLSKYERGRVVPSPRAIPVLARALRIEVEDLFEHVNGTAA